MKTAIVFGASCQDSFYLSELLRMQSISVYEYKSPRHEDGISVLDYKSITDCIQQIKPTYIFNLAAVPSLDNNRFRDIYDTIFEGNKNILESIAAVKKDTRCMLASSAYAYQPSCRPIDLSSPYRYDNPYSLARVNSVNLARYYNLRGISCCVAHMFNHESPSRSPESLFIEIVRQTVDVYKEKSQRVAIRNDSIIREWGHAKDTMKAFSLLKDHRDIEEIIIGTGVGYSPSEVVRMCTEILGVDKYQIDILGDEQCSAQQYVACAKQIKALGWGPTIHLRGLCEEAIASVVNI
jgi:GDP-D-mannose dehydratase